MFFGRPHLGSIQGLLQTSNVASTAVGPLIVGVAHDALGDYSPIVLAIGGINICLGAAGALFLRVPSRAPPRACQTAEEGDETDSRAGTVEMTRPSEPESTTTPSHHVATTAAPAPT